jgi:hypothetical protein
MRRQSHPILLLWMMLLIAMTSSCVTKTVLIRQSLSPVPEQCKGVLYVAQNTPIRVGIEGSDELLSLDMGGYYLIHKNDLKVMIQQLKADKAQTKP